MWKYENYVFKVSDTESNNKKEKSESSKQESKLPLSHRKLVGAEVI